MFLGMEVCDLVTDLAELAADCAEDGTYGFPSVAAPLTVAKGSGSPVNPVVVE